MLGRIPPEMHLRVSGLQVGAAAAGPSVQGGVWILPLPVLLLFTRVGGEVRV